MGSVQLGMQFSYYHRMACQIFETLGYPTVMNTPGTTIGFIHSLGHGVGLQVHERPFSGFKAPPEDLLDPGVVFAVEPGLYFPEQGYGIRLEDICWITADGWVQKLIDFPLDLALPLR